MKKILLAVLILVNLTYLTNAAPPEPVPGADAAPDLFSADLAGSGSFTTSQGGAPASAVNPAQGAGTERMVFDAGYLFILPSESAEKIDISKKAVYMQSLYAGALFPTKYGVFGGSLRYIGGFSSSNYAYFGIDPSFGGNLFAAKEVYPGMSVGLGFNFGFGGGATASADLGFRYNMGNMGFLRNFTMAVVLGELGLSYYPTWLTPSLGVYFDLITVEGKDNKPDPFVLGIKADALFPSLFYPPYMNMIIKAGIDIKIADIITVNASWPGGSGFNIRESADDVPFNPIPSIGLSVNILLPSGGERIAGGRLPSDGDLKISAAYKPLYQDAAAIGGGVSWFVGRKDTQGPNINLQYADTVWFSPNNDGKADALEIPISITDQSNISSWSMEIKDENDVVVRIIENKEQRFESFNFRDFFKRIFTVKNQIDVPENLRWDGHLNDGSLAPDGKYKFTITSSDEHGNTSVSPVYETVIKNTPPFVTINTMTEAQKIFDPRAAGPQGGNSTIVLNHTGSSEDAWVSEIFNSQGEKIRTFEPQSGEPGQVIWNGRDDAGRIAPDGVYSYRISAQDKAGNSAEAVITNIILDSREAGAFVTSSVNAIAPKPNQAENLVDFNIRLLLNDGIENWKLELTDEKGQAQKTFEGTSAAPGVLGWNGLTDQGTILEGVYTPKLTVNYTRGDAVNANASAVLVDVSGPVLGFSSTPEYFSPDNDGVEDELIIMLSADDASPVSSWRLDIFEPEPPYNLFRSFEGRGRPSSRIIWDGKSYKGELVQSAMDYPYKYSAADSLGNSSLIEGKIEIDVLVIRDGDVLRIQIPSIVFRPDFADFNNLPKETVDNNMRIIRRIAQILNKFRDYRVQVEGHANTTQPPGPARDLEQLELQRLSEARARAVLEQLVQYGVSRSRLSSFGVGGSRPVATFEDEDNWWKNRRVEFILVK